jgi:hypothetical protein
MAAAQRCDALVATDCAPTAVEQARVRLGGHSHVEVGRMQVPHEWPDGPFDLVVLSELLYYLDGDRREALITRTMGSLSDDGHIVTVHYWSAAKVPGTSDDVHDGFRRHPGLRKMVTHGDADFVLDVFVRRSD